MTKNRVLAVVGVLLVLWIAVAVIGFIVKAVFWLAVVGIVLFAITAAVGYLRVRARGRSRS